MLTIYKFIGIIKSEERRASFTPQMLVAFAGTPKVDAEDTPQTQTAQKDFDFENRG
jgi:hypothetical protein